MTRFARMYPERVRTLVYLEAAYDRIEAREVEATFPRLPPPPEPTSRDRASPARVREVRRAHPNHNARGRDSSDQSVWSRRAISSAPNSGSHSSRGGECG